MTATLWPTYPRGTRDDASRFAEELQSRIGGRVSVGEYLDGIGGWSIMVAPPAPNICQRCEDRYRRGCVDACRNRQVGSGVHACRCRHDGTREETS